ncbi:MAG: DUF3810 domain-containing protein [Clostridia bacterium]|nr:DUF3810 domain-containing protein [Clostridia bacterium]
MRRERTQNYKRKAIRLLIAAGILAAILATLLILRTNATVSEWMVVNVSRAWIVFFSKISSIFPFSLYETFLYVAIISLVSLLTVAIVFFCKRDAARAVVYLLIICIVGLSFGNVYTLSAGFAYYRSEVDVPVIQEEYFTAVDKEEIFAIAEFMVQDFNAVALAMERDEDGRTVSPYTHSELSDKLIQEYQRLDSEYFSEYTPNVKAIASKKIMSHMQITGVFFAPFGEANVNPLTPDSDIPVTMAHELAHAKGAMRESDANLVAYYITITSDDEYLRYCGYKACYQYIFNVVNNFDQAEANRLYDSLDISIKKEWKLNNEFWRGFTLLEDITEWFNDIYLKLQGQKDGVGSYNDPIIPPSEEIVPGGSGSGADGGETIRFIR